MGGISCLSAGDCKGSVACSSSYASCSCCLNSFRFLCANCFSFQNRIILQASVASHRSSKNQENAAAALAQLHYNTH